MQQVLGFTILTIGWTRNMKEIDVDGAAQNSPKRKTENLDYAITVENYYMVVHRGLSRTAQNPNSRQTPEEFGS